MLWQFLRTGTKRPVGVATATEMSTKFLLTIYFPSMTELTTGYSSRARVQAFRKKDMKPNLTPYFFKNYSPNSCITSFVTFRMLVASCMSTSWKVESRA